MANLSELVAVGPNDSTLESDELIVLAQAFETIKTGVKARQERTGVEVRLENIVSYRVATVLERLWSAVGWVVSFSNGDTTTVTLKVE